MESTLRTRLLACEPLLGTVLTLADVALAELSATLLDFVWIDLEHGAIAGSDVLPLAIAARAGGAASLVRLRDSGDLALGPALDAGVDGVVVPHVDSAEDAERVAGRLRHTPHGSRGLAARRASNYGRYTGLRPRPVCMVQIESGAAVEDADAIAAVDGVDALMVGCADLAASLGDDTDAHSDRFREAIANVQLAAESARIASGIAGPDDPALLVELAGGRSSVLVLAADVRIYARALEAGAQDLRRELALRAPEQEESHVST